MPGVKHASALAALPASAKPLFERAGTESFDLGADWFALLEHTALPQGQAPRFEYVESGQEVVAVLPLLVDRSHILQCQARSFTTFYSTLFRPLLGDGRGVADLASLLGQAVSSLRLSSLTLQAMDPQHPSFEMTRLAMHLAGLRAYSFRCFVNWYLPVAGRTYADYFSGLSSQTRNTVRRRGKKFAEAGRGRFELVQGGERLESAIAIWTQIYQASWKQAEPFPDFMPGLIRLCAGRGWLRLGIAFYDDKPIAAQVWIVNQGRAAIYKLAYDEAHAEHSAGTLLTDFLMRHVIDVDRVDEVDYLIGDEPYKQEWMSHRRERWGLVGYNLKTLAGWLGMARQQVGEWKRRWA